MNIYLLSQDINTDYDTFDSMVVYANSEEEAKLILPPHIKWGEKYSGWAHSPNQVEVTHIGYTNTLVESGIVLASFNAG